MQSKSKTIMKQKTRHWLYPMLATVMITPVDTEMVGEIAVRMLKSSDSIVPNGLQINLVKDMKDSILKVAEHLKNGTIDSDKARSLLLNLFGVSGSLQPLTIDTVNKMLKKVSKETWIAVQGDEHGWKEWYAERCKLNLNSNDR